MASVEQFQATLEDLYRTEGKAELIGGRIVRLMPTGYTPGLISLRIGRSLDDYSEITGKGRGFADNVGFTVAELPSGRRSFSPDAAYYDGDPPRNKMRFISGAPRFAVEIRSENDYGDAAEDQLAAKRGDYFTAGTLVVWDVDPLEECVRLYRREDPETPIVFRRGDAAHAEPAVPGWTVDVDWLLR
ncbi:MAG TPA: Uma2 family endonuclease [Planctomycetaceae bacterium]|nr:Uma2 family endonuclease [Planctomycetaceae bacterium]